MSASTMRKITETCAVVFHYAGHIYCLPSCMKHIYAGAEKNEQKEIRKDNMTYWCKLLSVSHAQLVHAIKATGSNLLHRVVWFLKAEGCIPRHVDIAAH